MAPSPTPQIRAAATLWARAETRRRFWALIALGLLGGVAAAVALASFAGARQASTAWDRLRTATDAPDAVVFASQVNVSDPDWAPVAALPYVESAGSFGLPFLTFTGRPDTVDPDVELGTFTVAFGDWRTAVDRPVIEDGRAPDPTNAHEVLAPPEAKKYGVRVGDHFTVRLPSAEQLEQFDIFSDPQGDDVDIEVVGIGRSTFESAILPLDDGTGFIATPAFHEQYTAPMTFINNLLVRFKPGQGSVAQLEADTRAIFDKPTMPVLDVNAVAKRVTNGTSLEANGLALFGLAVALAGGVLVGQAVSRSVRVGADDVPTLRAMGFRANDAALALALPHLVSVAVAAVVAVGGAVLLSPRFPIGLSRRIDPDVGWHVDGVVVGVGVIVVVVLLVVVALLSARRATAPRSTAPLPRRSRIVEALAGAGAAPSITVGAGFALEPGRDRRSLPTRPALVGVVVGVIGVIGAQTFLVGMDDAIASPARFGATWDAEASINDVSGIDGFSTFLDQVEASDDVTASALSARSLIKIDGVTQPTYSITPTAGTIDFTPLHGRRPEAPREVALGPETAERYGVGIGDTVTAEDHTGAPITLDVVGIALLPTTPHSSYDQGAWVTPDQLEDLAGAAPGQFRPGDDPSAAVPPIEPTGLLRLRSGVDAKAWAPQFDDGSGQYLITPATEPIDLGNLRNVRSLPLLFALFTLVLAVGTVAHVCASVVRRRGTEIAVLKALGMTSRNVRAALAWQATTLSVIGLAVGIPLGMVLGRTLWRLVADETPLVFSPPVALLALVVALPVTILLANLIAAVPGRRVARVSPAELLHQE